MKTGVIYARYSSDSQTEQSIEGQVRVCKQYAEKHDIVIVDQYVDRAMTGTNDNRAALQQMIKDSKKKQFNVVLVYKLDRFARNKYESVVNRKKLTDNGVELVSAMENIPDTPEGKLFLAVIEGFNEYFSEDLRQKVNRGMKESWLKGYFTGGMPIFGWNVVDKKYVIDEYEADIVREVFQKYAQGYQAAAIAQELKARGARRKNGKLIDRKYLYVILHDKRYTGVVAHQGVEYTNIFPRIISDELWNAVNAINQENQLAPSRKKEIFDYILSGKLICGDCKHKMGGESGTSHTGEIHRYYICLSKRKNRAKCNCKAVKKEWLEDAVIQVTMSFLQSNAVIHRVAELICNKHEKLMRDDTTLKHLQQKYNDARKAADNIVKAIEQGIITEFTKDRLVELQTEMHQLEFEINKERVRNYSNLNVDIVEKFLLTKIFTDTEDIKMRKLLVNTFVREILWYGDRMVITFNFQDGTTPPKHTVANIQCTESDIESAIENKDTMKLGSSLFQSGRPLASDALCREIPKESQRHDSFLCFFIGARLLLHNPIRTVRNDVALRFTSLTAATRTDESRRVDHTPLP